MKYWVYFVIRLLIFSLKLNLDWSSYLEHSEHGKPDIIERRDSIVGSHPFLNTYGYVGIAGVTTNRCSFFHTFVTRISRLVFLYHLTWRAEKKTYNLGMILLATLGQKSTFYLKINFCIITFPPKFTFFLTKITFSKLHFS